ncbi:MAG TPA: hypothetical protein DCM48_13555 [Thalassospira sp.]|nr:hypothetical protein [Thalassospira sp.]|tara:strand:- start:78 stop:569 length:492 start_codon:yes stop_codon:yes gene_type:complete
MRYDIQGQNGLIAKISLKTAQPTEQAFGSGHLSRHGHHQEWFDAGIARWSKVFLFVCPHQMRALETRHAAAFHTVPGGVPKLLLARQGENNMQVSNTIDCNGLSPAPTLLRIMQALVGREDGASPLNVLVGSDCNCERLADSLGPLADEVQLASDAKQFAAVN